MVEFMGGNVAFVSDWLNYLKGSSKTLPWFQGYICEENLNKFVFREGHSMVKFSARVRHLNDFLGKDFHTSLYIN